jgi:hypothetical protein
MAGRPPPKPNGKRKKTCPVLENPELDCYCLNLTSLGIQQAVHYCLDNFLECPIYKRTMGSPG